MPFPRGENRGRLEEISALHLRQDGVLGPQTFGFQPVVIEAEIRPFLVVVAGVAGEDGREQLEHVEGQTADVYLLEDRGDGRLVGILVELDGRDLVLADLGDEIGEETTRNSVVHSSFVVEQPQGSL